MPKGVSVDGSGNVYVADTWNHRTQKFNSSGVFLTKWSSYGSGDGQFDNPEGVAVDSLGNVYVADTENNRVQKFNSSGVFLTKWSSYGSGDGQFDNPEGVAVDGSGNVYVADTENNRTQKFNSSGTFLAKWGSSGWGDGQFSSPQGMAVDGSGNVCVADTGNSRIQKFDSSGTFLGEWGSYGLGDGQFRSPQGVAVDGSGNMYVADTWRDRIQKFDSSGTFLSKWGSSGSGDGQFGAPQGVAVDGSGNVYVADTGNSRIQKFDSNGTFLAKWGSSGLGDGQFSAPQGVAVDGSGNVYVADTGNHRIQKFDSGGTFLTKWGSSGSSDGQFSYPQGVAVDGSGDVYVADTYNNRIQKFSLGAVNGQCGSADGKFFASAPTTNLCSHGTASPMTGTAPWTWTCYGLNGGTNASCSTTIQSVLWQPQVGNTYTYHVWDTDGYDALEKEVIRTVVIDSEVWYTGSKPGTSFSKGSFVQVAGDTIRFWDEGVYMEWIVGPDTPTETITVPYGGPYEAYPLCYTYRPGHFQCNYLVPEIGIVAFEEYWTPEASPGDEYRYYGELVSAELKHPLEVYKIGDGRITSSPAGINCRTATCSALFSQGTVVTLTPTASKGSVFVSWSGCDSLSGTDCVVTMSETRSVTANFSRSCKLTVSRVKKDKGDGTISSSDGAIACGADCSESYIEGMSVILSATPAPGSVFSGWSPESICTGTEDCTVSIDKAKTVKATFVGPQTLTVKKKSVKKGTGTVTSSPDGINCGTTCKASFAYNSSVVLTASTDEGSIFSGWSPASICLGTGTCTVTLDKAKSVTANFAKE